MIQEKEDFRERNRKNEYIYGTPLESGIKPGEIHSTLRIKLHIYRI